MTKKTSAPEWKALVIANNFQLRHYIENKNLTGTIVMDHNGYIECLADWCLANDKIRREIDCGTLLVVGHTVNKHFKDKKAIQQDSIGQINRLIARLTSQPDTF